MIFRSCRGARAALAALFVQTLVAAPVAAQTGYGGTVAQAGAVAQERITLTVGRSTVVATDFPITRIAITDPAVADAVAVQPRELLVDAKGPGTVSLIVWGADTRRHYEIVVNPAVSPIQDRLRGLFPDEPIAVTTTNGTIILSGRVSSAEVMTRAAEIAAAIAGDATLVNLLQAGGDLPPQQVMLQVRFAEVSRRAISELGATLFTGNSGFKDFLARSSTQQFAAPDLEEGAQSGDSRLTFSDFLNLFLFNTKHDIGVVIRALQTKGLFQSLAEPNLIAYNGQEASFLAGGEIPIPVVQGATGTVTIVFKEFGVRLTFRPTITGDTIRLKVRPEVSTLDFSNGIDLQGFRIPALSSRRAETEVELRNGQSFAIAGLLDNLTQEQVGAVPWLSKLPVLGNLFKSKSTRSERTELMVLITPRLVRPLDPDEVPALPRLVQPFLPPTEGIGGQLEGGGGIVDAPAPKGGAVAPITKPAGAGAGPRG